MAFRRPRVLLVEDDRDVLALTCALLGQDAEVDCASDPSHAIRQIAAVAYDLLVTDLNIENPGDGLLVAGAMRCLQPRTRTVLISGYPDFTRALISIQSSLDLTLMKPVEPAELRHLVQEVAPGPATARPHGKMTLWNLLEREQEPILRAWLHNVEADPNFKAIPLSGADRLDHMVGMLSGLCRCGAAQPGERASAEQHGRARNLQGYRPEWVTMELSHLRRAIFESVLRSLLEMDLSRFPYDLLELDIRLDADMLESLRAFGLHAGD